MTPVHLIEDQTIASFAGHQIPVEGYRWGSETFTLSVGGRPHDLDDFDTWIDWLSSGSITCYFHEQDPRSYLYPSALVGRYIARQEHWLPDAVRFDFYFRITQYVDRA